MLKLHAGISRKVGLPGFSSASASCQIEAELDSTLLNDHEGFQIVVQRAYQSCEQAVEDQIARLLDQDEPAHRTVDGTHDTPEQPHHANGLQTRSQGPSRASQQATHDEVTEIRTSPAYRGARIIHPTTTTDTKPSPRPATASQVKAIRAICARRRIDLVNLLRDRFGLTTADELGIRQASNLIDELKNDEPADGTHTNGNGALSGAGVGR